MRKPSKKILNTLSQNIIALRKERNITQEDLAYSSGLHRTYIGAIERGERNLSLNSLEMLANAFEVDITILLMKRK